jgi:hypothetical protein
MGENGKLYYWCPSDPIGSWNPNAAIERENQNAFRQQAELASGLLQAAHDELRRKGVDQVFHGKDTPSESSAIVKILGLAERQLRKVVRGVPQREKEIQDAFESLVIGAEIDYSREAERIEYSSKTYVPDFTFRKIDVTLEIKLCNRADREKEIIAEINDDILAYRGSYRNIVFVIYDLGYIRDVDRFTESIAAHDGVLVRVVKQ